jgi:hypothetical protein
MEEGKFIHLVAFNVPYPPNYGGIIDIYYKLKALHEEGFKIILHTFLYERPEAPELKALCHEVHYYKRGRGIGFFFSKLPYIVSTRKSERLESRLLQDAYPVIFEGLHTTYYLEKCRMSGKQVYVRTHNIEHNYYRMLANSERFLIRKIYLYSESRKLARYEKVLGHSNKLLSISGTDTSYFQGKYGNAIHVSAFHQHAEVESCTGMGDYVLFHGNLSVPENEKALAYLVKNVLSKVRFRVIIAGKDPSRHTQKICMKYPHIELVSNPSGDKMNELVKDAHINLLYTYQPTGLKLKLLHSLHAGRHCMANPLMLSGSGLDALCTIYTTPKDAIQEIERLMRKDFDQHSIDERSAHLKAYKNSEIVKKIASLS